WLPMPVACALGDALGSFAYLVFPRFRRQSAAHVGIAFGDAMPPRERRRVVRRSFALLGRGALALFVAHRLGSRRAHEYLRVENGDIARAALAEGKGLLFVSCHYGCFELVGSWAGVNLGCKAISAPGDDVEPAALLIDMRRDLGCETIERGSNSATV